MSHINCEKTSNATLKLKNLLAEKKVRILRNVLYKTFLQARVSIGFFGIRRGDRAPRAKHFSPRGELAFPRRNAVSSSRGSGPFAVSTVTDLANVGPKVQKHNKARKCDFNRYMKNYIMFINTV